MSGFYPSRAMPPRLSSFRTSPPYTPFIGPASRNASYGFPAGRNETGNALNPVIPSTSILRRETSFVSEQEISPLSLDYRNDDPGLTKVDSMRIAVEQICLVPREKEHHTKAKSLAMRRGQNQPFHLTLTANGLMISPDTKPVSCESNPFTPVDQMIPSHFNPPPAPRQSAVPHPNQGGTLRNGTIPRILSFGSPGRDDQDLTPLENEFLLRPRKAVVPLLSPIRLTADCTYKYSPHGMDEDDELYGNMALSSPTPTRTSVASR